MEKGQTNNPNGRKKGSPNLMTRELRELLRTAFNDEINSIPATLKSMEPKERLDMLCKFLPYFAPKMQSIAIEDNRDDEGETIRRMVWNKKGITQQ